MERKYRIWDLTSTSAFPHSPFFAGHSELLLSLRAPSCTAVCSYLAGGTRSVDESGAVRYRRKTVFLNTLFFVLGISFTFFLLGLGFTAVGRFFSGNQRVFATIGGVIVILFGLLQLGVFQSKALSQEQRLPLNLGKLA